MLSQLKPAEEFHVPVLVDLVTEILITEDDGIYIDATVGGGGHSESIMRATNGRARLIALDIDREAIEAATGRLSVYSNRVTVLHSDFIKLPDVLHSFGYEKVSGILFDIGVSSHQIDSRERGFSYRLNGPLDMRMDLDGAVSAFEVINRSTDRELARIFRQYGGEKVAGKIARKILRIRQRAPIKTTAELSRLVELSVPPTSPQKSVARVFQAVRLEVNREIEKLRLILPQAIDLLKSGGRIVVISYHSLEEKEVKSAFSEGVRGCICPKDLPQCVCGRKPKIRILTPRGVSPSKEEIEKNSRARSARLRAAEHL